MKQTYWKIRTDSPYLEASLYKLDLPDEQIKYILNNNNITGRYYDGEVLEYIYIPDANNNKKLCDVWNAYRKDEDKNDGHWSFNIKDYIYKGEVEMTLDEAKMILKMKKFNI